MTRRLIGQIVISGIVALVVAACSKGGGGAAVSQGTVQVAAFLTRGQQNPAFDNLTSSGVGSVTYDSATGKLSGVVVTTGMSGFAAHIHSGTPGVAGPVEVALAGGPTVWTVPDGTVLSADQAAKLKAGELYFAVHSTKFPGGEIRGQLNEQVRTSLLNGSNETQATGSNAIGTGILALDPTTRRITGFVRTAGVTGVAAHIHSGAAGASGPVLVPLEETSPGSGIWAVPSGAVLSFADIASFNTDALYFNVHSAAFPAGEIRGQIVAATLGVKTAQLSGSNETTAIATSASGTGIAVVNSVTGEVFGAVQTSGVTGTLAHIHDGDPGVAGPVVVPLAETPAGSGIWLVPDNSVLTSAAVGRFTAGGLYYNVHSAAHPAGELRGQISVDGGTFTLDAGASGPAGSGPSGTPTPRTFPSSNVSFANDVQVIFNTYCVGCHTFGGIGGFMPLTAGVSYGNLVNVPAVKPLLSGTRIVPGNSAGSVLYQRVANVGLPDPSLRMPQGGPFLDTLNPSALTALKAWIDEGALNN